MEDKAKNEACHTEQEEEHKAFREKVRALMDQTFADLAPKLSELLDKPQTPKQAAYFTQTFVLFKYAREHKKERGPGWVYFVRADDLNIVKIGYTDNLRLRLDTLRGMSPVGLSLIASFQAPPEYERSLHKKFAYLRDHGEWFKYTSEIHRFIKDKKSAPPPQSEEEEVYQ